MLMIIYCPEEFSLLLLIEIASYIKSRADRTNAKTSAAKNVPPLSQWKMSQKKKKYALALVRKPILLTKEEKY